MGESNPTVHSVLAGRSPEDVAAGLLLGCKIANVAVRKSLVQNGKPAVAASDDSMIRFTRSLETPFNFVSTSDTIGGNSGSPIVARSGAVVGLNFDRNRYGLSRDFGYDDRQGRNIAVDVRAITEALRSVYHADSIPRELRSR
jgi:Peptidase S46